MLDKDWEWDNFEDLSNTVNFEDKPTNTREEFEKWYKEFYGTNLNCPENWFALLSENEYEDIYIQSSWEAWQEQQKKIDELKEEIEAWKLQDEAGKIVINDLQLKLDIKDDAMRGYQLVIEELRRKLNV